MLPADCSGAATPPSPPRRPLTGASPAVAPSEPDRRRHPTRNLKRLLQGLGACPAPHLLDLGRLCDQNIEWLIHQRCKVTVDDQITALGPIEPPPAAPRSPRVKEKAPPPVVHLELRHAAESFDAILCWDLFDYLDRPSMSAALERLTALLKPKGYLLAFFNCERTLVRPATRYRIVGDELLEYEGLTDQALPGRVYENREIHELFEPFDLVNSCYLTNQMREILVQKKPAKLRK